MIQIPLSILLGAGGGLVTAVVFIFRLLITSNERRVKAAEAQIAQTLAHHETFVKKAQEDRTNAASALCRTETQSQLDRDRYTASLEKLVNGIAAERNALQEQVIRVVAENTSAIVSNTRARESAAGDAEKLFERIPGLMIAKLVELRIIATPVNLKKHRVARPTR